VKTEVNARNSSEMGRGQVEKRPSMSAICRSTQLRFHWEGGPGEEEKI